MGGGLHPVECGRSKDTVRRSDLAGCAEYGYCASHSRYFWGLRLHLLTTLHGLPMGFALTGAKADERQVLLGILDDGTLTAGRAGQIIIGDKNYYGHDFEATLASAGLILLRPARQGEPARPGARLFRPLRQIIESVKAPSKGSSIWNATAVTPRPACSPGSCSASSLSPPPSGTTTRPASPSCGP